MKALFEYLNTEKINKTLVSGLIILFTFFGFLVWNLIIVRTYIQGVGHSKQFVLLILGIIWTVGFISVLFVKMESKFKPYSLLMLIIGTVMYDGWITHWGFKLYFPILHSWNTRFFLFVFLFVLICFTILSKHNKSKSISNTFSRYHLQEVFIFVLIFSMVFFITLDSYSERNPANWHPIYFSERNLFTGHYRLLVPSVVDVISKTLKALDFDYLGDLQRLYKIYMMISMTLAFYLYYFFLQKFFKKQGALVISVLLLLLFHISFKVAGLIEDPANFLSFVIGIMLIYYRKDFFFWILIFISAFNKELVWVLIFMYFVHNLQFVTRKNWKPVFERTLLYSITFFFVNLFKFIIKPIRELDENREIFVGFNITCGPCFLKAFLILSIFWIPMFFFKEFPKKLRFFARLNFVTPFYIVWSNFSFMREMRWAIPIGLILIPLGMSLLFPDSVLKDDESKENKATKKLNKKGVTQ